MAIAAVAAALAGQVALLVAQVMRKLSAQHPLHQRLLQLLEEPGVSHQLLGAGHPREQLVQNLRLENLGLVRRLRHRGIPSSQEWDPQQRSSKIPNTLAEIIAR